MAYELNIGGIHGDRYELNIGYDQSAAGAIPVEAEVSIELDLEITIGAEVGIVQVAEATIELDLDIEVDATVIGPTEAEITIELDLQFEVGAVLGTVVQGTALRTNKRMVAIGNDELWYEDI